MLHISIFEQHVLDKLFVENRIAEYSVLPEPGVRRVRATVPGSERRYIFRCCCASPPRELSMAAGSVVHGRHAFYMPVLTNI